MANLQKDGTYSVVPRIPGGEITPGGAHRDRRGRRGLRALHEDHRRAADRPLRRPARAAAGDLAAAGRRRLRVRARLRQGAAHGEVVRRLDLVPLRRPGLGRAGDRPGAALPRPARAAQAQARRLRLRARVRRGPGQGRRRDRDREGLEPLRRRQRRLHAAPRPAVRRGPRHRDAGPHDRPVPHVLRPHRRPAPADRRLAGGRSRAGSTTSGPSSSRTACGIARRPRRGDGRATWTATPTSGRATLEDPEKLRPVRVVRQRARTSRTRRSPTSSSAVSPGPRPPPSAEPSAARC